MSTRNKYNLSLYKMSKDYALLKEMLDKGMTPIVLRHGEPWIMAKKSTTWEGDTFYGFSAGTDISCQPGVSANLFAEGCASLEIEFVAPTI